MRVAAVLAALAAAVIVLAATSTYSAWVASSNHGRVCRSQDVALNVMTNLLIAAQAQTDSDPTVTAAKKTASDRFVAGALEQIADARC